MSTPSPKPRDPWFDNAKMALVVLVVVGHAWTLLPHNVVNDRLYDFLYVWHVPAFVFVTGYLSRSFEWESTRLWQLFRTVVVPYVLFECLLAIFRVYVGGEHLEELFADPHWPMWYLSALFFWRLLTPVFRPLWGGFVVAVGISLLAGLRAGDTLDVARVLGLLPFFVLGLKASPERLDLLRRRPVQVSAVGALAAIFLLSTLTDRFASTEALYYRSQYDELSSDDTQAMLVRVALLLLGAVGALSFLALVPRVNGWFTRMGAWTLVVYLFHGFVVKSAQYAGFPGWAEEHQAVSLLLTTAVAVALALALAWKPVATHLNTVVDPLGYAERHVREAVALTVVKADAEAHAEGMAQAISEHSGEADRRPDTTG